MVAATQEKGLTKALGTGAGRGCNSRHDTEGMPQGAEAHVCGRFFAKAEALAYPEAFGL
jgi:hypothetical protein